MFRRRVLQWLSGSGSPVSGHASPAVAGLVRGLKGRWPRAGIAVEPDFVTVWTDGVGVGVPTGRLRLLEAERPARVVFEQAHLIAEVARVLARPEGLSSSSRAVLVLVPQWRVERSDDARLSVQRLVPGLDVAWGRWTQDSSGRSVLLLDTQHPAGRGSASDPAPGRGPDKGPDKGPDAGADAGPDRGPDPGPDPGPGPASKGLLGMFNPELSAARYGLRRVGVHGVESRVWTLPDAEPGDEPRMAASRLLDPWGWGGGTPWSPGWVVAVPCSDRLWVAHESDAEACAWLLERSWEDWLGRTHALIPRPLLRAPGGWELWEGHA